MQLKKKNYTGFGWLAAIVCFVTVLSQLPVFVESGITNRITIPLWLVLFCVTLIKIRGVVEITELIRPLYIVGFFTFFYVAGGIFNKAYWRSELPYQIVLSVFILINGAMIAKLLDWQDMLLISKCYIFGCVILSINVYTTFFMGADINTPIYLYAEKNSTGQILMTAIILITTLHLNQKEQKHKWIYIGALVAFVGELLLMRSRGTLVFFPVFVLLLLWGTKVSRKMKWITFAVSALVVLLLIRNDDLRNNLVYDVLYAGRNAADINAISSGRINEWQSFFADMGDNWLFGQGRMKRESLILTAFLEFGIIFGTMVLVIAVYPLLYAIVKLPKDNPYRFMLICVAVCYMLNGIFEQLAPFGPGAKCFFLWLLLGVLSNNEWKCGELRKDSIEVS